MSINLHNVLDYVIAACLVLTPYVFGFSDLPFGRDVFFVLGCAMFGYSLLTDYSFSVLKAIPARTHMIFDYVSAVFVMLAPWLYGYREELTALQLTLHFICGACLAALPTFTERGRIPPSLSVPASEDPQALEKAA
jgi:drug/metabolite transporter (DMT)-like permease